MTLSFSITAHAVDRYCEHFAPGLSHAEARAKLEASAQSAIPLREKSINGDFLWRLSDLDIVLITKRDHGVHVAVTVLPPAAMEGRRHTPRYLEERMEVARVHRESIAADEARIAEAQAALLASQESRPDRTDEKRAASVGDTAGAEAMRAQRAAAVKAETEAASEIALLRRRVALVQAEAAIVAIECKTIRNAITEDANARKIREALRFAMRALHGAISPGEAMAEIAALDPGLTSAAFLRLPDGEP